MRDSPERGRVQSSTNTAIAPYKVFPGANRSKVVDHMARLAEWHKILAIERTRHAGPASKVGASAPRWACGQRARGQCRRTRCWPPMRRRPEAGCLPGLAKGHLG